MMLLCNANVIIEYDRRSRYGVWTITEQRNSHTQFTYPPVFNRLLFRSRAFRSMVCDEPAIVSYMSPSMSVSWGAAWPGCTVKAQGELTRVVRTTGSDKIYICFMFICLEEGGYQYIGHG